MTEPLTDERLREAVEYLSLHNCWRSGAEMEASDPRKLDEVIDTAIAALAELAELRNASQNASALPTWMPIESAPMDGSQILCYIPYGGSFVMQTHWFVDCRGGVWYCEGGEVCPTHWMPLPPPPAKHCELKASDAVETGRE